MRTDREWMYNSRFLEGRKGFNPAFIKQVESFVEFACQQPTTDKDNDLMRCPCSSCMNRAYKSTDDIKVHVVSKGFVKNYYQWTSHGEPEVGSSSMQPNCNISSNGENEGPNSYRDMILEAAGPDFNPNSHENVSQPQPPDPKTKRLYELLHQADEPLWPDCTKVSQLSLVSRMLNIKSESRNWQRGAKFFAEEFTLNYLMATYAKPQVSLLKGIVMGGGAGASMHGRFRVATDNTVFAMPDASIGIFPDVGASFFLSRLPGFFGEYMGLTGARLDGPEMFACGLATHYVPLEKLCLVEDALCKANTGDPELISNVINEFSSTPNLKEKSHYKRLKTIDKCFSKNTVEEIIYALEQEADKNIDDWISWTIRSLRKASPTSLKVSLRSIREGRHQGVGQCLIREYRMACTTIRGDFSRDIYEGFRATLQDKDKKPKWAPSKVEFVSDSMVDRYFEAVNDKDLEDLKLPLRTNLTSYAMSKL